MTSLRKSQDSFKAISQPRRDFWRKALSVLGATLGWIWMAIAGGGGLSMLIRQGPWPLTNGWFALASGLCACPVTAWVLRRYAGRTVGWALPVAAAACFIAGRIALMLGRGSNG
jgi:hypothetical protein